MKTARHFWVSGKVQAVFFRASTRHKAIELGLTGWVRNLPDGRVEALACGDVESLRMFERWLWEGPEQARVSQVQTQSELYQHFEEFTVRLR